MKDTDQIVQFIDSVPIPALVLDTKFNISHVNAAGLNFFSKEIDQLFNQNIADILYLQDPIVLQQKRTVDNFLYSNGIERFNLTLKLHQPNDASNLNILYIQVTTTIPVDSSSKRLRMLEHQFNIYNQFLDTIKEGVFVFNSSGKLIFANKTSCEFFALEQPNKRVFIWNIFEKFKSKSNWETEKKIIAAQEEATFLSEISIDGQLKSFLITISHRTIYTDSNYLLIVNDITENKKQEAEIQKKEYELNIFYHNLPVAIFEFVVESFNSNYFTYLSESFSTIFPISIPTHNKNWLDFIYFNPDDFQLFLDKIHRVSNEDPHFNYIGRFEVNKEMFWFEITANVIKLEGKFILNGVIKNITENKKIEAEIVKKGKFNNLVLDNIPADIAVFDENHNYKFINKKGIENDALRKWLINKNDFDYCALKGLDTTLAEQRRGYFNLAKSTKKQVDWVDEIKKNEKTVYIYRRFYPVYVDGELNSMIGYGIDITELKDSQNLLNQQNAILTEKNKELERFAYIASHDLQEPLISIIGYSDLLKEYHKSALNEEGQLCLDFINKSALRMRTLINALMEYSRIDNRETLKNIDLNQLVEEIQVDLSSKIKKYGAVISMSQLPNINCYPTFMRILVQNIISNAIKYTSDTVVPIISIAYEENSTHWIFKISDNGIGIEEKKYEEIFLIFKRLHNPTDFEGNGIGLAHCKKIATIHQGDIWVDSTINKGSTFYFSISKNIQNA